MIEGPGKSLFATVSEAVQQAKVEDNEHVPLLPLPQPGADDFLQVEFSAIKATGITVNNTNAPAPQNVPQNSSKKPKHKVNWRE